MCNDIFDDFVKMRALDAAFAKLKSIIVDDIVTSGIAFRRTYSKLVRVDGKECGIFGGIRLSQLPANNE